MARFMESEERKICRACAEAIQSSARLCPYCQTRQSGFPVWEFAPVGSAILFMACSIGVALWTTRDHEGDKGPQFVGHRQELQIVHSTIERARQTPESWMSSLGTNRHKELWPIEGVEVRFLDSEGSALYTKDPIGGVPFAVEPCYWLTGVVTNLGKFEWWIKTVQVRFYDTQTNLVDVEDLEAEASLRLPPKSEQAFRIPFAPTFTNRGLTWQARVQTAKYAD